jgi:hypothetical protein
MDDAFRHLTLTGNHENKIGHYVNKKYYVHYTRILLCSMLHIGRKTKYEKQGS